MAVRRLATAYLIIPNLSPLDLLSKIRYQSKVDNFKIAGEKLNKGAQFLAKGEVNHAIALFESAIKSDPNLVAAHFDLALAYQKRGDVPKTIKSLENTIKLKPDDAEALNILGYYYTATGKLNEAVDVLSKALKINHYLPAIFLNMGVALTEMGRYDQAVKEYKKALVLKPDYVEALTNIGAVYARQGKFETALISYQKALEIDENFTTAYIFLGNVLLAQGSIDDSILCYKMAIEKDPKNEEAYNNLGTAYAREHKYGDAVRAYKKSLTLNKNSQDALENLAIAYSAAKKIEKSIIYLQKAFKLYPNSGAVAANLWVQLREAGNWSKISELEGKLNRITNREIKQNGKPGEDPFTNVIRMENSKKNFELARLWSDKMQAGIYLKKVFKFGKISRKKINIGYVSAHFHDHPTNHLITKLFSTHNKEKFNVFVYSLSPDDGGPFFRRIKESNCKFADFFSFSFSDSAKKIYEDKIDILIDLDGYTDNNRLQIFAIKPAPVQVTYLGFPGTTGSNFMDYMISDKIVSPETQSKYYSEKFIYMPNSYQINNNSQKISSKKYTRADFGLPQKSFVFACFNGTYKIEPELFDIWMRLLKKVPGSVLWLLKTSDIAEINLKKEAKKRGMDPKRLVFSGRLTKDKHLARLALADLALDTFTCNGHTTTSDCLWAGVPVVTKIGKHFASRVSASLLTAVGLPKLITETPAEYERLILSLAKNPKKLAAIRESLILNRKSCPLFDTERFTRNLENAYEKIWKIYQSGKKPKSLTIKD